MNALLLSLILVAAAESEPLPRLLVLDLEPNGVEPSVARSLTGVIIAEVGARDDIEVLTQRDVARAVELEQQRQLIGCTGDASCLAEVAGALGASLVLYGDVGKLGTAYVINLALLDGAKVKSVGYASVTLEALEDGPSVLRPKVAELFGAPAAPVDPPPRAPRAPEGSLGPLLLTAGGGTALAIGIGLAVVGAVPLATWSATDAELNALEPDGVDGLGQASEIRGRHLQAAQDFESWGQWAILGGTGLVVVGTGLIIIGLTGGE